VSHNPVVHEPYSESSQQREADLFGMYIFLGTEAMLFGGLLAAVYVIRVLYPHEAASAAQHLKLWLGTANTAVLLTSSLFIAIAVAAARAGRRRACALWLALSCGLGILFLGIKAAEYVKEYREGLMPFPGPPSPLAQPAEHLFFNLYLVGTSLHALHLTIGSCVVAVLAWRVALQGTPVPRRALTVEVAGLYWHLVDVVWVFIFPVFYLAR
jgi:cytochrome c oxidase subunit 3